MITLRQLTLFDVMEVNEITKKTEDAMKQNGFVKLCPSIKDVITLILTGGDFVHV